MLAISCFCLVAYWQFAASVRGAALKLRSRNEALTTTEWALLVAGAAAIAIAVVGVVRTQTNTAANKIQTGVDIGTTLGGNTVTTTTT